MSPEIQNLEKLHQKKAFICDMDGVVYHGNKLLPGVREFVNWLKTQNKQFLFLTNSSDRSPRELQEKLQRLGVEVAVENFYTSALATAAFLAQQNPGGSAFVIGEEALINALQEAGFSLSDSSPDYVVMGETRSYNYEKLEQATLLVRNGAKLIGTNPDISDPSEKGIIPATGALISPLELATNCQAYFPGKPNPLMIRNALKKLACSGEESVIIGDRMDTDIRAGIESEIDTVLVLSGVSSTEDLQRFAYRPQYIFDGVGSLVP